MTAPAITPRPPYYAVIFTSTRTPVSAGYAEMSARMMELAAAQDGFLGVESVRVRLLQDVAPLRRRSRPPSQRASDGNASR